MKLRALLIGIIMGSCFCWASNLSISADSLFAVVTHKAGLLSSLGHDHFIHAGVIDASATMNDQDLSSFRFEMSLKVKDLVADDPQMKETWLPSLKQAAVLEEDFEKLEAKQRKTITKRMLGKKQLNADAFPLIKAWVEGVKEKQTKIGDWEATHELRLKMEIHGVQQTFDVPAAIAMDQQTLSIRAIAPMKFTDFDIKPFSAMLGSLANENRFHIFVDFKATVPSSP